VTSPALWDGLVRSWVARRHACEAAARAIDLVGDDPFFIAITGRPRPTYLRPRGGVIAIADGTTDEQLAIVREAFDLARAEWLEVAILGTCRTLERERLVEVLRRRVAGGP